MMFASVPALANPFESIANKIQEILTGGLARTIAIVAIVILGYLAFVGYLTWVWAIRIILGIVLVFGAVQIFELIRGGVGG
jgi:type IV secretion system protein VirB2